MLPMGAAGRHLDCVFGFLVHEEVLTLALFHISSQIGSMHICCAGPVEAFCSVKSARLLQGQ